MEFDTNTAVNMFLGALIAVLTGYVQSLFNDMREKRKIEAMSKAVASQMLHKHFLLAKKCHDHNDRINAFIILLGDLANRQIFAADETEIVLRKSLNSIAETHTKYCACNNAAEETALWVDYYNKIKEAAENL